eukprot:TRINITY_DN17683_c0_g1_i1.p1 TRINITY_DN17683_c0_g1~~TRINITY_DN17683_c0_g1_i1.p1  ORF type:complete len:222 (+),score=25.33 TRINITY_DN17683_c0_g1_i1:285-950(+)
MAWPIYFYIPNIIGYARVIVNAVAFAYAFHDRIFFVALYFISFFCDYLDGRFAVWLNQKSTFGAVLDMVTDRMSTAGLLMLLSHLYPEQFGALFALLVLDIASHWLQTYSTFLTERSSHKDVAEGDIWLLRLYYRSRLFMGYCCVGAEVLYLALVLLKDDNFRDNSTAEIPGLRFHDFVKILAWVACPGWAIKQIVNLVQMKSAADVCVRYDMNKEKWKKG